MKSLLRQSSCMNKEYLIKHKKRCNDEGGFINLVEGFAPTKYETLFNKFHLNPVESIKVILTSLLC